ncbi:MAG: hypothetical protein ABID87_08060 [Chloroflexota bacterium]
MPGEASAVTQEYPIALQAKIKRVSKLLTREAIAQLANVSVEDVDMFERGLPLHPAIAQRLLRAYLSEGAISRYLLGLLSGDGPESPSNR